MSQRLTPCSRRGALSASAIGPRAWLASRPEQIVPKRWWIRTARANEREIRDTKIPSEGQTMTIEAINPATGEVLEIYDEMTPATLGGIIGDVHNAFLRWRSNAFAERAAPMRKAAEILRAEARDYARLMAREMGKPVRDGVAEAQKCALACDFYAENAARFLSPEPVATDARNSFVTFNPL